MNYFSYGIFSQNFMELHLKNQVKIKQKNISKLNGVILKDID